MGLFFLPVESACGVVCKKSSCFKKPVVMMAPVCDNNIIRFNGISSSLGSITTSISTSRVLCGKRLGNLIHWQSPPQPVQLSFRSSHFFNRNVGNFLVHQQELNGTKDRSLTLYVWASEGGNRWGKDSWAHVDEPYKQRGGGLGELIKSILHRVLKLVGVILLVSAVVVAAAPSILSWPTGLKMALSLANHTIPGTISVSHASLGWRKPVKVEGITLKGVDGRTVVSIPKIGTRAPLWSIVTGRSGLGETVVTAPVVDLQQDPKSGQPHLALALTPLEKLLKGNKKPTHAVPAEPPADVVVTAKVKSPNGGLEVTNAKLTLPQDAAAVIGPSVYIDVATGNFATDENDALREAVHEHPGRVPVVFNMWSDRAQAEALGFLNLKSRQMELLRPLKAEMDLTPSMGKLYLARVNPLLGEIVGPAIGEEDLPDVTVYVAPAGFVLPADEYSIRIEPLRATLAKGQLVDGVLSLVSREDLAKGRAQLTMQTSPIEATVNANGNLACSRMDLLIADRVHVATWGLMDTAKETIQMTLAIPGSTLRDLLGLSKLSHDYYLKIPVKGSFDRPQVDWMAAGKGIAQLTLRQQRGGELFSNFFQQFEEPQTEVPRPIDVLPWDTRR
ncbi:hypothetical protein CY35_03G091900 [Sphagnum magellanicum]|nr:hypothetical protein CY35_03G091900 [Sphagnum magellanicum]